MSYVLQDNLKVNTSQYLRKVGVLPADISYTTCGMGGQATQGCYQNYCYAFANVSCLFFLCMVLDESVELLVWDLRGKEGVTCGQATNDLWMLLRKFTCISRHAPSFMFVHALCADLDGC